MKTKIAFDRIMSSSVFRTNGPDINLCDALVDLCDAIEAEDETNWYLGEYADCCLCDLLPGAYWALTEWHAGQYSPEYRALCAIGSIFQPGMSQPPTAEDGGGERIAYEQVGKYFELRK